MSVHCRAVQEHTHVSSSISSISLRKLKIAKCYRGLFNGCIVQSATERHLIGPQVSHIPPSQHNVTGTLKWISHHYKQTSQWYKKLFLINSFLCFTRWLSETNLCLITYWAWSLMETHHRHVLRRMFNTAVLVLLRRHWPQVCCSHLLTCLTSSSAPHTSCLWHFLQSYSNK